MRLDAVELKRYRTRIVWIEHDKIEAIFEPFTSGKGQGGTGLGLAVVQKVIVQHGGQVEVRNRPEGGAEFIITLPLPRRVPEAVELRQDSI